MPFPSIERADITDTYKEAELARRHMIIQAFLNKKPDARARDIINAHPELSGYHSVNNVLRSIRSGSVSRPLRGVNFLEERQLLPMNIHSKNLQLFNLLMAMNLWSGTRSKRNHSTGFYNALAPEVDEKKTVMKEVLSALGLNWEVHPIHNVDPEDEQVYDSKEENGSLNERITFSSEAGRLIQLMNYPAGAKKFGNLVPGYINSALEILKDISADLEAKHIAFDLIHDFLLTLLFFRLRVRHETSNAVSLITFDTTERAERHTALIKKMLRCTMPGLRLGKGKPKKSSHRTGYHSRLTVYGSRLEEVSTAYRNRVSEVIDSTPKLTLLAD